MQLLVVPGLAYDLKGNRLGQGRGCYDQILAGLSGKIPIVGLAFDFQVIPEVPVTINDVRVDYIVSEKRTIECRKE